MATALPYIDTDIDVDPICKTYVNDLIEAEIATSGGHDVLLKQYLKKVDGAEATSSINAVPPQPMDVVDLSRYELAAKNQNSEKAANNACVVLEYERMKQTNLLLVAQIGLEVWKTHGKNLDAEALQQETVLKEAERTSASINLEREKSQKALGTELADLSERWGSLAYGAAMLRGALEAKNE